MSLQIYYGGTFDPVHKGHIAIACTARDQLNADIFLLPAADPPHRAAPGASAVQRAEMLALAIARQSRLQVDRRELDRSGPSYSIDTMIELRQQVGFNKPLAWLIGSDAFLGLPSWHRWLELFMQMHFVVAPRPGFVINDKTMSASLKNQCSDRWRSDAADLHQASAGYIYQLSLPLRRESATAVRHAVQTNGSANELDPLVLAYIQRHALYQ